MSHRIAIYPGSFDPITLGHIDLIQRLSGHFDELVVLIAENLSKSCLFSTDERVELAKQSLASIDGIRVEPFSGLTVTYAQSVKAKVIIRGLRAVSDFEYELGIANMNRRLAPEVETMMIFTSPEYSFVSSKLIKEVAKHGGSLKQMVPNCVEQALQQKLVNK